MVQLVINQSEEYHFPGVLTFPSGKEAHSPGSWRSSSQLRDVGQWGRVSLLRVYLWATAAVPLPIWPGGDEGYTPLGLWEPCGPAVCQWTQPLNFHPCTLTDAGGRHRPVDPGVYSVWDLRDY